jgi:exosortase B
MSSLFPARSTGAAVGAMRSEPAWLLVIAGFVAMYVPVYVKAAASLWQEDDNAHGALILAVLVWLFWGIRRRVAALPEQRASVSGALLFGFGLFVYFVGRVFDLWIFELGSQVPVVAGLLLLMKGPRALAIAWFPVIYFIFMVPLPGPLIDAITGPLKQWISAIVVDILYLVGYPISRNGVVLTIGQYQMLVADACSGLHSMYSLSALGTLFMYIMARRSKVHNAIMLASILPIAFAANIVRVIALVLITYHFGDEAGQGFLHGAAGMSLMLVALVLLFALDSLLGRILRGRDQPRAMSGPPPATPATPADKVA